MRGTRFVRIVTVLGLSERLRRQGFFEPAAVQRVLDHHVSGREDLSRQLWGLLAFTLWHERHVEREPAALRESRVAGEVLAAR